MPRDSRRTRPPETVAMGTCCSEASGGHTNSAGGVTCSGAQGDRTLAGRVGHSQRARAVPTSKGAGQRRRQMMKGHMTGPLESLPDIAGNNSEMEIPQ